MYKGDETGRMDLFLFEDRSYLEQRNSKTESQSLFASTMSMSVNFQLLLDTLRRNIPSKILALALCLLRGLIKQKREDDELLFRTVAAFL